jgi:ankyrin repeat protein
LHRFLLAQLHLDSLIGKKSPKAIRAALKKLPTGSKAYDYAYTEAMQRIEGQITDCQELAKQVLAWITCAKRPLTTSELRHALAVEVGECELDEENLPEIEDIVSVCAGLATVDEESNIIRLVHYTTQEFFERTQVSWFPNAQTDITIICVSYLSFSAFESGPCPTVEEFEARLQKHTLYDYAARYWGYHAPSASSRAEKAILGFLEGGNKVSASTQAMMLSGNYRIYGQRVPKQTTGMHLAAYLGLREVMMVMLQNGHNPNLKDALGRPPLSWAIESGHEEMVRLLLAEDGVDPDSKDTKDGRTPLSWAAENGHEAVVKLLLEKDGVDLNYKDAEYGQTPLSWAAENGHEAVVRLLLAKDAVDPDSKDNKYGRTPLSFAAEEGHEAVVKLLLEKDGVDLNHKDTKYGQTPLSWAAEKGKELVVQLLLENGADKESLDNHGRSILHLAARGGHTKVIDLLIDLGLDVNAKDRRGGSTLHYAASGGSLQTVERILKLGPIIHSDSVGWSPLHWAARSGNLEVFKLLREAGVAESTCNTIEPLCSWNSLRIAVLHRNQSLAIYIRTLVDDKHPITLVKGEQPLMDDSPSILADVFSLMEGDEHDLYEGAGKK